MRKQSCIGENIYFCTSVFYRLKFLMIVSVFADPFKIWKSAIVNSIFFLNKLPIRSKIACFLCLAMIAYSRHLKLSCSVAYPGCLSRIRLFSIPDPICFHPGSESKNLSILTQKMVSKL